jgi:hypothetical protein
MDAAERVLEAPLPQGDMAERTPKALPQRSLTEGMTGRDRDAPQREGTTAHEHELKTPRQGPPIERGHIALSRGAVGASACRPTRGDLTGHRPSWPSRVGASERTWPLGEAALEAAPKTPLEVRGTCQPKKAPPWRERDQPKRPFGASKTNAPRASLLAQEDTPGRPKIRVSAAAPPTNRPLTFSLCLHHFPSPISRASCRVPRPSARPLDCQGQGRRTESPLVASVTLSHTRRHTRPHTCALATHPAKLCQ